MDDDLGESGGGARDVRRVISRHWKKLAAAALLLVVVGVGLKFWDTTVDAPDPQERIGLPWIRPAGTESAYAGNEACQPCHAREFDLYSRSPHARTVQEIAVGVLRAEFNSSQKVTDKRNSVTYAVQQADGKNEEIVSTGGASGTVAARWVFGSGSHAWSYLDQTGDKFFQLRVSYYRPSDTWNFTPGTGPGTPFQDALGDSFTPGQAAACFGCHSTVLIGTRKRLDLAHSLLNVGCESCHGPCRTHIESMTGAAGGKSGTVLPPTFSGPQIMALCGVCHRVPSDVPDASAAADRQIARFPGVALQRSQCFIASEGKLSCVTCHDPHEATHEQTEDSFNQKCITCHTAPHGKVCAHGETNNCVSCHMPNQLIAGSLPLKYHNHWIRVQPEEEN